MLKQIAQVMVEESPIRGYVARIGGDEFVVLIPRCTGREAEEAIGKIRNGLQTLEEEYAPSVALGSATKISPEENINTLIDEADMRMYDEKGRMA